MDGLLFTRVSNTPTRSIFREVLSGDTRVSSVSGTKVSISRRLVTLIGSFGYRYDYQDRWRGYQGRLLELESPR
jgi:hypothetical protein